MAKKSEVLRKDDIVQAIIVADNFGNDFVPISNDIPIMLLPLVNKPLIDYTLEFLSLGGIEETFLFCCSHVEAIRTHINKCINEQSGWSITMKVNIIISESCRSFGDCLRDIDAKGLLRGNFVLLEPGAISNMKLLPLIKKHSKTVQKDKGAAITLIFQEAGIGQSSRNPMEEDLLAVNDNERVLFHKKIGQSPERKVDFPLEIFLEHPSVSILHNLKDTHIAICSPSVLPLFSDNFDFQTKDDFVKGLLINEEILGSTIYCHILKGGNYGAAVSSWRMYHAISWELQNSWIYPLLPPGKLNKIMKNDVIIGKDSSISNGAILNHVIIGHNVTMGKNVQIRDSFIFSNCKIGDNVVISNSLIGPNCTVKAKSKITAGSVLGKGVVIETGKFVENALVQANEPEHCEDSNKLGKKAFKLKFGEEESDEISTVLVKRFSRLHIGDFEEESDDDSDAFRDSDDDNLSHTHSPLPDDTKLFFTEVIDSLTRGFEDELQCDNLILEINSSRYAYNVTLKEVNFNVLKAILHMSLRLSVGSQYFVQFVRLLSYFSPILKNYIRNEDSMIDALQAIEDVAISNENINEKWVMFVLKWFYDKDYLTEDVILDWFKNLDKKSKFHAQVKPFADWLQEAEEASSSEEE